MKVLKFGGTSVGKPERMQSVARLISSPERKVVVLSALSGTTNTLVSISENLYAQNKQKAQQKIKELQAHYQNFISELYSQEHSKIEATTLMDKHFDELKAFTEQSSFGIQQERVILAQGELMSTKLFQVYAQEIGIQSVLLPALEFMQIDADEEPIMSVITEKLQQQLAKYPDYNMFITQGYICLNHLGEIDNLKRGGSDYTASLVGAALEVDEIQIWTDIDGMHNNDPRFVPNTFPVEEVSFDEAAELAYFGAKILHPASIRPAQQFDIPVRLLNTMQPEAKGTTIKTEPKPNPYSVTSIAAKDGIIAIKVKSTRMLMAYGFLRRIFEVFEKYKTPIDMITTSEVAVSLTIDHDTYLNEILKELEAFGTVEVDNNQSIICIVGSFVTEQKGKSAKIFESLKEIPIRMISFGGSRHNVSVLISTEYKIQALNLLNEGLF
jgi:aspartate kinase